MTSKTITITSKNQITLPAEFVRRLQLNSSRFLTISLKGKSLELKPQLNLEQRLQKQWVKLPKFTGTKTDKQLKQAISDSFAQKQI